MAAMNNLNPSLSAENECRDAMQCVSPRFYRSSKYSNASTMSKYTPSKPAARMRFR